MGYIVSQKHSDITLTFPTSGAFIYIYNPNSIKYWVRQQYRVGNFNVNYILEGSDGGPTIADTLSYYTTYGGTSGAVANLSFYADSECSTELPATIEIHADPNNHITSISRNTVNLSISEGLDDVVGLLLVPN